MQEAVKLAKERGFKTKYIAEISDTLKPEFWQALCAEKRGHTLSINPIKIRRIAHEFIDHILEGKDPELFFKELLTHSSN